MSAMDSSDKKRMMSLEMKHKIIKNMSKVCVVLIWGDSTNGVRLHFA